MLDKDINIMDDKYSDTINYILKNHHSYLKEVLPELENFVFTIFRVHFNDSGEALEKLYKLFSHLKAELNSHIIKEERALFFMIKDYEKEPSQELISDIKAGIQWVREDNEQIKGLLKEIREVTDEYTLPSSSCATYEATYDKLKELESYTHKHLEIEEKLFQRLMEEI